MCVRSQFPVEDVNLNEGHSDRRDSSEKTSEGNLPAHTTCLNEPCPSAFLNGLGFQSQALMKV